MHDKHNAAGLRAALPNAPLVDVDEVYRSMGHTRNELEGAGLAQFKPFADVYHAVTGDVRQNINTFKEPQALNVAADIFYRHYAKQHRAYLDGDTQSIEPHWKVFYEDSRVRHVDEATLLLMGMAAHIGGDLGRSVFESNAPINYIAHDYPMVNQILWQRAHNEAHRFVPSLGSEKIRRGLTNTAMLGIVSGRRLALEDYRKLERASSPEETATIITNSHNRTATVVRAILAGGFRFRSVIAAQQKIA